MTNLHAPLLVVPAGNTGAPNPMNSIRQRELSAGLNYELGIDSFFAATHALRPDGAKHTHSFRVQASFVTADVDENGMIVGFRDVARLLEAEAKRYANQFLNEIEPFTHLQPTGENLAAVIFRDVQHALTASLPSGPRLIAVTLWENPTSYVRVGTEG